MSMLKEYLQTSETKSETSWKNLFLKELELLILMLSHGQQTIPVHIDFLHLFHVNLFQN